MQSEGNLPDFVAESMNSLLISHFPVICRENRVNRGIEEGI